MQLDEARARPVEASAEKVMIAYRRRRCYRPEEEPAGEVGVDVRWERAAYGNARAVGGSGCFIFPCESV